MRLVKGVTSGPLRSAPAEAGLVEMLDYSLVAQRVIGLENQQVVGPARQDLLGDCGLAAHGVQRHDAVFQRELVQQFRDGSDLIGRLMHWFSTSPSGRTTVACATSVPLAISL